MLKKIRSYFSDKLGIAQNRFAIEQLNHRFDFLASYINITVPEEIHLDVALLWSAMDRLKKEFPLKEFNTVIHKNDLMFAFHVYKHQTQLKEAVYSYFKVGMRTTTNLQTIIEKYAVNSDHILDFGSGYGRVSRFLPQVFSSSKISVSEVKGHSLKFQHQHFGFNGIEHNQDPDSLGENTFDLILALSVFTHLPKKSFELWLKKLIRCLNSGGGLIFTFGHISQYKRTKPDTPDFHYSKLSEDSNFSFIMDSLNDTAEYGSTFVSHAYLKGLVSKEDVQFHFLKNELAPNQESLLLIKN